MTTKTRKPTPTEKLLAAAQERLAVAASALKEAHAKNAILVEQAREARAPIFQRRYDLQAKLFRLEGEMLLSKRIRVAGADGDVRYGPYHPDLIAAVEKALGVSYEKRSEIRIENRKSWSKGADPFVEALNAIEARAKNEFFGRPEIVALKNEVQEAFYASLEADDEVRDVEKNITPFHNEHLSAKRAVEELEAKVRKYEDRRLEREWAKEAAQEAEEENLLDPVKARKAAREIVDGTLALQW